VNPTGAVALCSCHAPRSEAVCALRALSRLVALLGIHLEGLRALIATIPWPLGQGIYQHGEDRF